MFGDRLFDFQAAAVKIAAHHLNKRNGVLIGDVVGLGKTLMATAVARIFEDDYGLETLIICPKNLVPMWEDYMYQYQLRARVLSLSRVLTELPNMRRYRLVVIDESHNLRNREGRRYRAIQEYVRANESKCILLSATPYNKTYLDLSSQLRIFVEDDQNLGIRPERYLKQLGELEFSRRHQASPRTLAAFDFSEHADDWRDLMRLYLVRRTRSFIQDNYAETDQDTGRKFLTYEDGSRSFFPTRVPKTVKFAIDESNPNDQYAQLYSQEVVDTVNELHLPRYGLGNYVADNPGTPPTTAEERQIDDLSRAGKRLMGFCRTNLFKRLESSGAAYLQSVERHVLRNYVFLHAIKNGLPLPLGTQDAEMLDSRFTDEDADQAKGSLFDPEDDEQEEETQENVGAWTTANFEARAAEIYAEYEGRYKRRFKWLRSDLFLSSLESELQSDANALLNLLQTYGAWDPAHDTKLDALHTLLTETFPDQKVLVFSQFADTVLYLEAQLKSRGVQAMAGVTGNSADPTQFAWRFSPNSNQRPGHAAPEQQLRILVATDVLSEGQNLQDCSIVVNYDLPWAIIRLSSGRAASIVSGRWRRRFSVTPSCPPRAWSASSTSGAGSARGFVRTQRWSARTRRSSRTRTTGPSSTSTTSAPASSTETQTVRLTWRPTPTRYGRTPSALTPSWRRPSPTYLTSCSLHASTPRSPSGPKVSSFSCARPMATTPSPTLTVKAAASPSPS